MVAPAATPSQQLEKSFFDGDPDTLVMALGEARRRRTAIVVGGVAISVAAVLIMIMSLRGGTKAPTAAAPVATAPAVQPPAPPPPAPAPAPQPAAAVAPPAPVPPAPAAAPPPTAAPTAAAPAKPAEVPAPAPPPPAPPVVEKPVEAPPAAAVAPEGDDLLAKCEKAYARGRGPYKAVVKACGAAIASNPRAAVPMIMIANMEFERGRYNDALQLAQRAIEIDPSIPEAYVFIGTAEQNAKRKAEARAAYEKYLQLAPTGKYARDVKMILRTL